ncbi:MAG: hypothetical protein RR885_04340 [Oscillospiraceae bacterium]
MKKTYVIFAATILSLFLLTGCDKKPLPAEVSPSAAPETAAPSAEPTNSAALPEETPTASLLGTEKLGNLSGNIQSGGFALEKDGDIYFIKSNSIHRIAKGENKAATIFEGVPSSERAMASGSKSTVKSLNFYNGRLFFVAETGRRDAGKVSGQDFLYEAVYSCKPDGTDLKTELSERPCGGILTAETSGGTAQLSASAAYENFTIINGYMYYITSGTAKAPIKYTSNPAVTSSSAPIRVSYSRPTQLCRAKIGGKEEIVVADMGNKLSFFTTDGEKLCYLEMLFNPFYSPYDHVALYVSDLDGKNPICVYGGPSDIPLSEDFYTDRSGTTAFIAGMQIAGDKVYLSMRDSQGDFPDGRLCAVPTSGALGAPLELVAEAGKVKSLVANDQIFYIGGARNSDGAFTETSLHLLTLNAEGGHNTDTVIEKSAPPADTYSLNREINLCGNRIFSRETSFDGSEKITSIKTDGSDSREY